MLLALVFLSFLSIKNLAEASPPDVETNARSIVEKATKTNLQSCKVARQFAAQAREIGRESLKANSKSNRTPTLLVFVSFSMPMETLKTLARDANRLGGKMILRGLLKGSFQETLPKLHELGEEILIDPTLFEAYQVKRVPTFVLREQRTEFLEERGLYDILGGNVSLEYALEQFAENGALKHVAADFLQNLRERP